ncbi:hypothetical protein E4U21_006309 [Claviceps maximensis]|nr:hypothetical protein E4U21_006309 [Claviceps maximensis]
MVRSKSQESGKDLPFPPPKMSSSPSTTPASSSLTSPSSSPTATPSPSTSPASDRLKRIQETLIQDLGITIAGPSLARLADRDMNTIEAAVGLLLFSRAAHDDPKKLGPWRVGRPRREATTRKRVDGAWPIRRNDGRLKA